MSYKVILYESKGGQKPVEEFIKSLQTSTQAKLIRQVDLLKEFGPNLGMPNAKPIGQGLHELRVRGKQEARNLYFFAKANDIYIVHAFLKKTRAISTNDINIALKRKKEIENL